MTDSHSTNETIRNASIPKRRRRYIFLTALGIVILFLAVSGNFASIDLEVVRTDFFFAGDSKVLQVTNVGSAAATIKDVIVNDRKDCEVKRVVGQSMEDLNVTLGVGDKANFYSKCVAIRASIMTDKGSESFSFGGQR